MSTTVDTVAAYVGMRKVSLNRTSPTSPLRIFLNNNASLQIGLLDQVTLLFPTVAQVLQRDSAQGGFATSR